jgi:hypothetical protein
MTTDQAMTETRVIQLLETVGSLSDELRRRRAQSRRADGGRLNRQELRQLEARIQEHWTEIRAIRGGAELADQAAARRSKWE